MGKKLRVLAVLVGLGSAVSAEATKGSLLHVAFGMATTTVARFDKGCTNGGGELTIEGDARMCIYGTLIMGIVVEHGRIVQGIAGRPEMLTGAYRDVIEVLGPEDVTDRQGSRILYAWLRESGTILLAIDPDLTMVTVDVR